MTITPPIEPGTADQRIPSLTVPEPLGATPGRLTTAAILSMTLRASAADHSTWRLPVVAFAVIATIILDVTGGAVMMWHLPGDNSGFYKLTSTIAVILLVLPLMTLAASAARLSARRRDDRLSSLRLVGASSHLLRIVALTEAGLQALIGSIPGITGYVLCLPLLGQLSFNGGKVGADSILLRPIPVAGVILTLVLLALVSSAIGLRKIDVSPAWSANAQPTSVGLVGSAGSRWCHSPAHRLF